MKKYTVDNIIGLKIYHKDYKPDDPRGHYTITETGVDWLSNGIKPSKADYTLEDMIDIIDKGDWIPREEVEQYQIF